MPRFIPKSIPDDHWKQLGAQRPFALLAGPDETIYLRLGVGKSLYLELVPSQMGARIINLLSYEAGESHLLYNLTNLGSLCIGRGSQCSIKIMNPIVSRHHVELSLDGNILVAKDLGTVNGTYVHPDNFGFDIDKYLVDRPIETAHERTLDGIHEAFGPNLDDFLKHYSQKKKGIVIMTTLTQNASKSSAAKSKKSTYKIAVLPGDGTGPEVVREGIKVLDVISKKQGFKLDYVPYDLGGERYKKTGDILPDSVIGELKQTDAIFLGAIGHPDVKPGILEKGLLLRLRFELDQYINLRPVKLFPNVATPLADKKPEDIDFVVVRENTEGLYAGAGGTLRKGTPNEVAIQESINTRMGVERCLRYAFEYTKKRNKRNTLTLCGKTNVLTFAFDLWERAFHEVGAKDYPGIKRDYAHVDATCMWMVKNPEWFDVIVTDNMFGDIITDLAAMIQGGMGIAAGGNLNPEGVSMFEPIGGSAPKYTNQNVINPLAAICAGGMLLDEIGQPEAARAVEGAVYKALESGKIKSLAAGKMGMSTTQMGDLIASLV